MKLQNGIALFHGRPEDGSRTQKLSAHALMGSALAREHENNLGGLGYNPLQSRVRSLDLRQKLFRVGTSRRPSELFVVSPPNAGCVADVINETAWVRHEI